MIRNLCKVIYLTLKLAGLRLAILWHSAMLKAVIAQRFRWLGSRWHIRQGAKLMGLQQRADEPWDVFQARVFDTHLSRTGIDVEAMAQQKRHKEWHQ